MTNCYKLLCGLIALGIAIFVIVKKKLPPTTIVYCYWMAVTFYWIFNFIGGLQ